MKQMNTPIQHHLYKLNKTEFISLSITARAKQKQSFSTIHIFCWNSFRMDLQFKAASCVIRVIILDCDFAGCMYFLLWGSRLWAIYYVQKKKFVLFIIIGWNSKLCICPSWCIRIWKFTYNMTKFPVQMPDNPPPHN